MSSRTERWSEDLPQDVGIIATLHRAGWSVGDMAVARTDGSLLWIVTGSNGENLIRAEGQTQLAAWQNAIEQACSLGMIGRSLRQTPEGED